MIFHINCNYVGTTLHQLMKRELEKFGYKNQVFVPISKKTEVVISVDSNVYVCKCFKKWDRLLFNYKQYKIYKAINNFYNMNSFSLIHAYTLFTDGNCARQLSKKYNIPYVVAVRNTDVNTFFKLRPYLRNKGIKIMLDSSAVFFLSNSYKEEVFKKYIPEKYKEVIEKKIHIIPNGIDYFWFKNKNILKNFDDKKIKLIYVGKINKNKNILTIQKVVHRLFKEGYNISLTIVGKVEDKKEFQKIKNDELIKYISHKTKEELIDLYRSHDIFIMPSFKETFGLVYVEAMTQGLPVIYTRKQGFDSQFKNGIVGIAVNPKNELEISEAVKKIVKDYKNYSKRALKYSKIFNWNDICNKYIKIYSEVIKSKAL